MKVALYARVSKALDQNPENQLQALREWAKRADANVIGEYVDEMSSKDTRPQKELILGLLRTHQADAVAFYALDRWGRTMSELVLEIEEFGRNGWVMMALKEQIDLSTAAGKMFAHILAAMANFERDRIKERTLLGLARARAQGKKLGRPFKDGSLNQVNYENPNKHEVFRLYKTENKSYRDIANILGTSKNRVMKVLRETPPAEGRTL
jgi:DNA invertase Pin-like site-specific DNA recombinase